MNQCDVRCKLCQEKSLFHRGVTSTYDDYRLIAKEETVACRTCRDTISSESDRHGSFAGNTEPLCRSTCGDDQCVSENDRRDLAAVLAFLSEESEWPPRKVDPIDP